MAFMDWSADLSVGVASMDEQHRRLIDLINELHEALRARQGQQVVGRVLGRLTEYTRTHFVAEEALLARVAWPGLAGQRRQHAAFVQKLEDLGARAARGELFVGSETLKFLQDWLREHILREDKAYGPHVAARAAA